MEIKEIIQKENDRLFIVDQECYIIYTGETLHDDKPFLRIGNWLEMPVELIPLIENIIITDKFTGNPSFEQFNINLVNPETNRYIGREDEIKKFFHFQTAFGLDLTNASIVNIDKDLPGISSGKIVSDKNEFTGLFLRNGNIRIMYNNIDILDLDEIEKSSVTHNRAFDALHDTYKDTMRYKGSGFIIAGVRPLIYHDNIFTFISFPHNPLDIFHDLGIDPGSVENIILPGNDHTSIAFLLKWKDHRNMGIHVYTDHDDPLQKISSLYPSCPITIEKFGKINFSDSRGTEFKNYGKSSNLKFTYPHDGSARVPAAFICSSERINDIMKDDISLALILFSVFAENTLLFKSWTKPLLIIDDGNPDIKKMNLTDTVVLYTGFQYSLECCGDLNQSKGKNYLYGNIISGNPDVVTMEADTLFKTILSASKDKNDLKLQTDLFNLNSNIRVVIYNTRDRKVSSALKEISYKINSMINMDVINNNTSSLSMELLLYNNTVYQFISSPQSNNADSLFRMTASDRVSQGPVYTAPGIHEETATRSMSRITQDRERLKALLKIYTNSFEKNDIPCNHYELIKSGIAKRKDLLINPWKSTERISMDIQNTPSSGNVKKSRLSKIQIHGLAINKKVILPVCLLFIFITCYIFFIYKGAENADNKPTAREEKNTSDNADALAAKYNITIEDKDIYRYANMIAVKNNYSKITFSKNRMKNPDWIYPGNVLHMHDGETVIVKKGDILWNIAKNKIISTTVSFYGVVEKIYKSTNESEKQALIARAKDYAVTAHCEKIMKELSGDKK